MSIALGQAAARFRAALQQAKQIDAECDEAHARAARADEARAAAEKELAAAKRALEMAAADD